MKKILVFHFFLLLTSYSFGQWTVMEEITLNWKNCTHKDNSGKNIITESFDGAIPNDLNIPSYHYRVNIPTSGELQVNITNEEIEESIIEDQSISNKKWIVEKLVSQQGNSTYANITVTPLRKVNSSIQKLISFTLEINLHPKLESQHRGPIFKSKSTLAEGTFYKIEIDQSGVYKISGAEMKDNLNIDLNSLDPDKLKIFVGNSGRLSETIADERIDDLVETPIKINGDSDGKFDDSDEIIFFVYGPDHWSAKDLNSDLEYQFVKNIYSQEAYVYLQTDGNNGLRIKETEQPENPTYISTDYDFLQIYGEDRVNLLGSYIQTEGTGQIWYSDYFGTNNTINYTDKFDFSGHVSNKNVEIEMSMAARSSTSTRSILSIDNNELETIYSSSSISSIESTYASSRKTSDKILINNAPNIEIKFLKSNNNDEAWLDYLQLINRRTIGYYGTQNMIQDRLSINHSIARFEGNLSGSELWNITDPENVSKIIVDNNGWNYRTEGKLQRFIAFKNTLRPKRYIGQIENQNLHSLQNVDLVILHPTEFSAQAERLADHRRSHDGYKVETVDVNHIYNEFSGGKQDVTALRDFAKMLHDRSQNFRYLLLLGDGSYDHRNIVTGLPDHNFVPAYETKQSLHPIEGFPTDDFLGLLSDNEGGSLTGDLDIAIGRLPVENAEQADDIIDKLINYDIGQNRFGDWRLRVGFVADDGDGDRHLIQNESVANYVKNNYPDYNQKKIYFDAFEQISTPGGDRIPDASAAINNTVQEGQLILNYLGHGGPNGWAQERVLKLSDIDTWNNRDQLPLLITATCTFTGYDDPEIVSAGEYAIRKKNGGCIGLLTTVRAVYSRDNKALVDVVFKNILEKENLESLTIGEVLSIAKNSITGSSTTINSRKFLLIGDPSMRIALPKDGIVTTHINEQDINEATDTIHALEKVKISGIIIDQNGDLKSNFNGTIFPTVYDKISTIETLGDGEGNNKREFDVYKNILFKGAASVVNGRWSFEFIVPKDINYNYGTGRISYYAEDDHRDASGHYEGFVIGGSSDEITTDDEGPIIDLFMDNLSFTNGGDVQKNTSLIVNLSDDLGINVSGNSIGHDLTATLDDGQNFVLNDYYKAEVDDFTKGQAIFDLNNLTLGTHSITVKAWDVTNNSSEATINFNVVEFIKGNILNTYIYPNPFQESATLVFEHDLAEKDVDLTLYMYSSTGQLLAKSTQRIYLESSKTEIPLWTLGININDFPEGIFFYKINLSSNELENGVESNFEKIVILD